jgi:hypothetical protein
LRLFETLGPKKPEKAQFFGAFAVFTAIRVYCEKAEKGRKRPEKADVLASALNSL